ncbi:probable threonine protease PRSS50 [Orycteropus afer afer]|uniref:Probable threonine protease PRSS50 n=1 Tax=Orycteropus afer afer TaxID=1230840 RepID=A0A8B7AUJ4_ORYAF|nr:probable threonine protease PRSS50 [Orycteropus afer afer]
MEPWGWTWARGQGSQCLWPSISSFVRALFLLLLLLRLAGCLGASETWEALSTVALADVPGNPRLRLPRQDLTTQSPGTTQVPVTASQMAASTRQPPPHTCGFSFEQDPTLRDPLAMSRRWPWMVSVRANGTHICAGTLIASQWVLVVAHCLVQRNVTYSVLVGSPVLDEPGQHARNVPVGQVIVNRRFRSRRYWSWVGRAHDVGLLRLQSTLKYSKYVWPICLPGLDFEVEDNSLCTVTGWGLPRTNGVWPQFRSIQEKEVTILNSKECDQYYHRFSKIPTIVQIINSQMICAEDNTRDSFCYEKSGEPLACAVENTWYLVGMVSWGPGCNHGDAPPIYLQVSSYQQWIWDRLNGQPLAPPAPSRALLLALPLPLSLLATL